ncbi:MAG: DUF1800 domain-containing protein [Burkholderiaceae bacterium]|jgi:uncharacterized protein (DUF1800 family)
MPSHSRSDRALTTGVRLSTLCVALTLVSCGGGGGGGSSSSAGTSSTAASATHYTQADATRLADQAAFGPTPELVAQIESEGSAWIDAQISTPPTGYPALAPLDPTTNACPSPALPGQDPQCYRDVYTAFPVQRAFFQNSLTGKDQLRQRVALAYQQIFVVSTVTIGPAYAMREYQQMLLNDAFVNFRQILNDVTLSPVMGAYLNMANNNKANSSGTVSPNENYAREVLQLFSIGPNTLNVDGTVVTDSFGQPVPTYTQDTIEGFASSFTGWTYPTYPGATPPQYGNNYNQYFMGQMIPFQINHDITAKPLLSGVTLPANQTAQADLKGALDNIFNHPNVGPFIGKQLIQFLVTSNPSPAYVSRVTAVFNNNGKGVRGDMGAVVKAILVDPEARGDSIATPNFGRLREPALYISSTLRALGATSDGEYQINESSNLGMNLFGSETVFGFYHPADLLPGSSTLLAPQFDLATASTNVGQLDYLNQLIYSGNGVQPDTTLPGAIGTQIDVFSYAALAGNPSAMVALFNTNLLHGTMSAAEASAIVAAVNTIEEQGPDWQITRAQAAAFLVLASPRYQIVR